MKKIFTLMVLACMTLSTQAQGKYALEAGTGDFAAGTKITSVENITLTFGYAGEADYLNPTADASIEGYTAYTAGNGVNGKSDGSVGTTYIFEPAKNGELKVAVMINANKEFYVLENGTALSGLNGITVAEKTGKVYTFSVTSGKTYKVTCKGSKLGFFGFEYTVSDDQGGDDPVTPENGENYSSIVDGKLAPEFIKTILDIDRAGFDCDYISERLLMDVGCRDGMLITKAGTRYKGLIIPGSGQMAAAVKQHIDELKAQGAKIFYQLDSKMLQTAAKPEPIKTECGLKAIRRRNATGYHYFMANLSPNDIHSIEPLAVDFKDAVWFNPLNGNITKAQFDKDGLVINLRSGESMILQTYNEPSVQKDKETTIIAGESMVLPGPWTLSFTEEAPKVDKTYKLDQLQTWQSLDEQTRVTMGTGVYTTHLKLTKKDLKGISGWMIDLGDVRESARVYINGQLIGCAWSVPFVLDCGQAFKVGDNEIRIEVTNLPANRIADLDRRGVKWRKMEEINVVDINYKKTLYDQWEPVPSGLNSEVKLIRY